MRSEPFTPRRVSTRTGIAQLATGALPPSPPPSLPELPLEDAPDDPPLLLAPLDPPLLEAPLLPPLLLLDVGAAPVSSSLHPAKT